MAHNEEKNIAALLERMIQERPPGIDIIHIGVVSSGSTDRTDEIVDSFHPIDPRIHLITQARRHGKCAAINLYLREAPPADFVVLLSGDILPEPGAVTELLLPLLRDEVGMTGGRPVPVNDRNTFFGFACHLIWEIHHRIALESPKLGEAVAFKNIIPEIPEDLAVDEAALEAMILAENLNLVYCPEAIIRNQGPENLRDFLKQRRRIQAGHIHLQKKLGYRVSTFHLAPGLRALRAVLEWNPRSLLWTFLTCLLVLWGRVLGSIDHGILKKRHAVWDIAGSTKGELSNKTTGR
jgi:cellulose synthase/poly-beta-1,6-N-acetylglucosamine synthase-like glycosyltransferase